MDLKKIAAISGKPGLFKVVKPTRSGVIVESLDEKKRKVVVGATSRMSVLKEVSIYTTDEEGSVPLADVILKIYNDYKLDVGLDSKASSNELMSFLKDIVPNYDEEKVYVSDVKKLVSWYNIIVKYTPETLEELANGVHDEDTEETGEEEVAKEEAKVAEKEAKPAAKKTSAKAKKDQEETKETPKKKPAAKKTAAKKTSKTAEKSDASKETAKKGETKTAAKKKATKTKASEKDA
ncbi:hypothetical protein BKI52_35520 [marine bacterium AO1-C]|nr:hypothetical protein BKI52_35520 [marine bacterium AO1-C]